MCRVANEAGLTPEISREKRRRMLHQKIERVRVWGEAHRRRKKVIFGDELMVLYPSSSREIWLGDDLSSCRGVSG